jgi:hypothetical protein
LTTHLLVSPRKLRCSHNFDSLRIIKHGIEDSIVHIPVMLQ